MVIVHLRNNWQLVLRREGRTDNVIRLAKQEGLIKVAAIRYGFVEITPSASVGNAREFTFRTQLSFILR